MQGPTDLAPGGRWVRPYLLIIFSESAVIIIAPS